MEQEFNVIMNKLEKQVEFLKTCKSNELSLPTLQLLQHGVETIKIVVEPIRKLIAIMELK